MIHEFQAPFVFYTQVKNHSEIKEILLPEITNQSEKDPNLTEINGAITSYYDKVSEIISDEVLDSIVWNPLQLMLDAKGLSKKECSLDRLWWNNYKPGGNTQIHQHYKSDWSGIYILHLEGKNTTTFYSLYGDSPNSGYMHQIKTFDELTEGYVMIFPGFLQHRAKECSGNRVIISFDVVERCAR